MAFTGYGGGPVDAEVAVAVDTPYPLGTSVAPVRLATYGVTPGAMSALVDVLVGRAARAGTAARRRTRDSSAAAAE